MTPKTHWWVFTSEAFLKKLTNVLSCLQKFKIHTLSIQILHRNNFNINIKARYEAEHMENKANWTEYFLDVTKLQYEQ